MHAATAFAPAPARSPAPCGAPAAGPAAAAARTGAPSGPLLRGHAAELGCGAAAALSWTAARRGRRAAARSARGGRSATQKEWRERCKEVAGGVSVFDVTLTKPLGAKLIGYHPKDPRGVGIGEIREGAGCWKVNQEVLTQGGDGMWVLEGDEILAVDGVDCQANIEKIVECIQGSESDSVSLTLSRHYLKVPKGPVKVVFSPSGNMVTVPRGTLLGQAAAMAQETLVCEVYKEAGTGKSYEMSKDEAPKAWDNTMPMTLVPAPGETKAKAADESLFGGTRVMDVAPGA